jgi:O-antigen ligase
LTTLAIRTERFARAPTLTRLQRVLMWLVGASGGIVFIEPAPYEFMVILAMVVFAAIGLSLRLAHLPLIFLLIAYNAGYMIGVLPVAELPDTVQWTAVSMFISITALFFALALVDDTERRLDLLLKGYLAVAVIVSIFGIITYFLGSETFMFAGRSRSTFKDPNVLGAFLVLPALLAVQKTMTGRARDFFAGAATSMILVIQLLLAFSRGAWAAFAVAVVLMLGFSFLTAATGRERRRIVLVAILGTVALAAMLVVILSVPQVSELFQERASFTQEYDTGRFGRFGRHILGAELALDHP